LRQCDALTKNELKSFSFRVVRSSSSFLFFYFFFFSLQFSIPREYFGKTFPGGVQLSEM
jgi:hypothetical protein